MDKCYGQNLEWTDRMAELMMDKLKEELTGSGFEETNDLGRYCECSIEGYKKLPFKEVMENDFSDNPKAISIDEKCTELSRK